jgi:type IV secretory pathway VirD2 relaxase
VVKAGLTRMSRTGGGATQAHLRYLERDGTTRAGERGHLYGRDSDEVDAGAFESRCCADRHQFRFIVAPEDGAQLEDLKAFTRELVSQVERDLGTRLDWVAVDHWNTGHPHTHIVVRGTDEAGEDLVIAREYIAHGMRDRARELATEWLGLRTEREIRESLQKEVDQERWTSLDDAIHRRAEHSVVDVRTGSSDAEGRRHHSLLVSRLKHLDRMGLAAEMESGIWLLKPNLKQTLRAMGDRVDIVRTMQRAFTERRECSIADGSGPITPITGRVAAKGLADELRDRSYLIIDGIDGRAHYITLASSVEPGDVPINSIVTAHSGAQSRAADEAIAKIARDGIYRTSDHLDSARRGARPGQDPETFVAAHVRRLEALRRAGIVERADEGVWSVPADLVERARSYDAGRSDGAMIDIRSYVPIEQQKRAIGATWLDRQLIDGADSFSTKGFAAEVREALKERETFLIEQGLAQRRGQHVILAKDLLATLRTKELAAAAKALETETGRVYQSAADGQRITGVYRRSLMLTSGRFAMLDDGLGFTLVPWRPVIEQRLGQTLSAVVRGNFVSWDVTHQRDLTP